MIPKLTIDTNCVINLLDRESRTATSVEALQAMIRYALDGRAQIAITTRVEADLLNDSNVARRSGLLAQLAQFPVIGTIARLDVTILDGGDYLASDQDLDLADELRRLVFPGLNRDSSRYMNCILDIDHLMGHLHARRDIFVTDDKKMVRAASRLRAGPGIVVMKPETCVAFLDDQNDLQALHSIHEAGLAPHCQAPELRGRVTFDYSSNNGRFAIGSGVFLFETRWSKAGDTSIHAYSDSDTIKAIALATSHSEIGSIQNADRFDFTSRTRTPQLGQIVIWRNANGFFAATKVVGIKDDTRNDDQDEVTFEFVVQPDGGADFSSL